MLRFRYTPVFVAGLLQVYYITQKISQILFCVDYYQVQTQNALFEEYTMLFIYIKR